MFEEVKKEVTDRLHIAIDLSLIFERKGGGVNPCANVWESVN